jgi:hypothetical protein
LKQFVTPHFSRFNLYTDFANCNHFRMTESPRSLAIAFSPRPWLTRKRGECAFPVEGEGHLTLSCCNPTHGRTYCPAHRSAMQGPRVSSADRYESLIIAWLEERE